jgi:uncharacterized membrane protein YccC
MNFRTIAYVLMMLVLGALVLANLSVILLPTTFNLLFTSVTAPLGIVILVVAGTIVALDLIAHQLAQYGWQRDQRALVEQLEAMRRRADDAEEARIGELRRLFEQEMSHTRDQLDRVLAALGRNPR